MHQYRSKHLTLDERDKQIIAGALLHDVGKVLFRCDYYGQFVSHPESGWRFLKDEVKVTDPQILDCVRFHHAKALKDAAVAPDSAAYIVYAADNVAAAADRRDAEGGEKDYRKDQPLQSVFNLLNGSKAKGCYDACFLNQNEDEDNILGINFPLQGEDAAAKKLNLSFYRNCAEHLKKEITAVSTAGTIDERFLDSLLCSLETALSFVPSSTYLKEIPDISLYDHSKITAAAASCIWQYLKAQGCADFKTRLFVNYEQFKEEKAFLLCSMDISGIQKFIYTISSQGALRSLRARSFYLDALMEHAVDELLGSQSLSRANLIYSGGGHCYLLLPNTAEAKAKIAEHEKTLNAWFIRNFGTALYIACGYAECAADDLSNAKPKSENTANNFSNPSGKENDRLSPIFQKVSDTLSARKKHRYSKDEILALNSLKTTGERECRMCRRVDNVDSDGLCPICKALLGSSKHILRDHFFAAVKGDSAQGKAQDALPLPFGCALIGVKDEDTARELIKDASCRRLYSKNDAYTGNRLATHLWVSDYCFTQDLEEYANLSEGIKRLGIMRCDIDNLGAAFQNGFVKRYNTLSRMATFSRQLSLFFKVWINNIFRNKSIDNFSKPDRCCVSTVYSGGDDVFIIGSWGDVIDAAVMLRQEFRKFCEGTLTLSCGIGIYPEKFPISVMATETEALVDQAKDLPDKDGITLFEAGSCFKWDEFIDKVIGSKYKLLHKFFESKTKEGDGSSAEFGKAFLYRLLSLLRAADGKDAKLNRARLAYTLSRLEPRKNAGTGEKEKQLYKEFSGSVYGWYGDRKERRELEAAIGLYAYSVRDRNSKEEEA